MNAQTFSRIALLLGICITSHKLAAADVYIVMHTKLPMNEISAKDLARLYKGRATGINGNAITPVDAAVGSEERALFLDKVIGSKEADYTGYWHVRRYTGQGTPPAKITSQQELFNLILSRPDYLGYVKIEKGETLDLPNGLKKLPVRYER